MKDNPFSLLLKVIYHKYFYSRYYHHLENISGVHIRHKEYMLQSYEGYKIPFENETFDIVISNAALEHIDNLDRVLQEVNRVTKKQGVSYHLWHNYYAFSGGHAPESLCLRYPWGHLRGRYETYGLNKLTPAEIHNYFSKYFDILALHQTDINHRKRTNDSNFVFEREDLLSQNIRTELQAFSEDVLLTRGYLIIGRKK
jgi:ubiquinone/menaquinone biosynthesis C-methylase UbiE